MIKAMFNYKPRFCSHTYSTKLFNSRTLFNSSHGMWHSLPNNAFLISYITCNNDDDFNKKINGPFSLFCLISSSITHYFIVVPLSCNPVAGFSKTIDMTMLTPIDSLDNSFFTATLLANGFYNKVTKDSNSCCKGFFAFLSSTAIFTGAFAFQAAFEFLTFPIKFISAIIEDVCDLSNKLNKQFNNEEADRFYVGHNKRILGPTIRQPLDATKRLLDTINSNSNSSTPPSR
jgi:hypothetical protein